MAQMTQKELRRLVGSGQYVPLHFGNYPLDIGPLVFWITAKVAVGELRVRVGREGEARL